MSLTVTHPPRVAWDTALALVEAARADDATASWCRDWVADLLGVTQASAFLATRRRLTDAAAAASEVQVQEGLWRVRIQDALAARPDLAEPLLDRVAETRARLG
ncbi:MAG: hypothetical protein IRY85_14385 [Micromonosporaceae bacterium]|nr:hypothetical protein [Micromonosporaceae bacterium]